MSKTNGNDLVVEECANGVGFDTVQKLTKREYFAAMALQGILANSLSYESTTKEAVELADSLIEALNEKAGG